MDNIKVNIRTVEDLKAPPILYKYRNWDDDFHKKLILDPSVYLSSPVDFEDPLDCKNKVRYDLLTDSEIFERYISESKIQNVDFEDIQHYDWALMWFSKSPLRDPIQRSDIEIKTSKDFNERFGILSLTADPLNNTMWEKYANNNKGFCVGYDSKLLFDFLGGGSEVIYQDILPIIKPFEDFFIQHHKQVFYKETKWSFEKEYRTHRIWDRGVSKCERNIRITKECIIEVILGGDIPKDHRFEIEDLLVTNMPHVQIKYN